MLSISLTAPATSIPHSTSVVEDLIAVRSRRVPFAIKALLSRLERNTTSTTVLSFTKSNVILCLTAGALALSNDR